MSDDFEIQQYMIENDGSAGEPWAVRDTTMDITLSRHTKRDDAVAACKALRNAQAHASMTHDMYVEASPDDNGIHLCCSCGYFDHLPGGTGIPEVLGMVEAHAPAAIKGIASSARLRAAGLSPAT